MKSKRKKEEREKEGMSQARCPLEKKDESPGEKGALFGFLGDSGDCSLRKRGGGRRNQ